MKKISLILLFACTLIQPIASAQDSITPGSPKPIRAASWTDSMYILWQTVVDWF